MLCMKKERRELQNNDPLSLRFFTTCDVFNSFSKHIYVSPTLQHNIMIIVFEIFI